MSIFKNRYRIVIKCAVNRDFYFHSVGYDALYRRFPNFLKNGDIAIDESETKISTAGSHYPELFLDILSSLDLTDFLNLWLCETKIPVPPGGLLYWAKLSS